MTTIDPMTSPAQEVYDWLAVQDGWTKVVPGHPAYTISGGQVWMREVHDPRNTVLGDGVAMDYLVASWETAHTHPITLDRLAGMLPDRWKWDIDQYADYWCVNVTHPADTDGVWARSPTELEARARVVAAVRMREVESKSGEGLTSR